MPFGKIAQALGISAGSPQPLTAPSPRPSRSSVRPSRPLRSPARRRRRRSGDLGQSGEPGRSLVIGTDKQGGLHVYDMQGKSLPFAADGKMNNVDLRDGFGSAASDVVLVTASDRTNKAVAIYRLDTATRRAHQCRRRRPADRPVGSLWPVHVPRANAGRHLCLHQRSRTAWSGNGSWSRRAPARSGISRCATSSSAARPKAASPTIAAARFMLREEDVGLWRVTAEPVEGAMPVAVDKVADNPKIKDDMEGVGLYDLGGGRGYLIVSSQGNNSYAVYRREGDHAYLGSFSVIADPAKGIDGISETDGLEVSSANLGPGFEHGAMIAQDGRNVLPVENQNFKFVPWSTIARSLKLEMRR